MTARRLARLVPLVAALLFGGGAARAQEGRFDVQDFRPWAGPQDLVMVAQSRPMSHLSGSVGGFLHFSLNPLSLLGKGGTGSKESIDVVGNRFQLDVMGAVGLFDWVEVAAVLPVVLYQSSDNLADLNSEGSVRSTVLGDMRLSVKVPLPGLRRPAEKNGFGAAVLVQGSLPTGSLENFASDGSVTLQPGMVFDYRTKLGILIALNAGGWLRPSSALSDFRVGSSVNLAAGVEVPVVRRWGLTVVGNVWANVRLNPLPSKVEDCGVNGLAGIRWYSSSGFTLTFGGGAGCSASLRMFASLVWIPAKTREWAAIERFKDPPKPPPPDVDPDKDGVIGDKDRCPKVSGPVENRGCPDTDKDNDGLVDRLDKCPDDPARAGSDGCPRVSIKGNKLVIAEKVFFATDQDVILPESYPILEEIAGMLKAHPEIEKVLVEGHTDVRASDSYNKELSQRRAESVMRFLASQGVDESRLRAEGFGKKRPIADNSTEAGMALNRRIEFTIEQVGQPPPQVGLPERAPALPDAVLPQRGGMLPQGGGVLPSAPKGKSSILPEAQKPKKGGSVLPEGSGLPQGKGSTLPQGKGSVLPSVKGAVQEPAAVPQGGQPGQGGSGGGQ